MKIVVCDNDLIFGKKIISLIKDILIENKISANIEFYYDIDHFTFSYLNEIDRSPKNLDFLFIDIGICGLEKLGILKEIRNKYENCFVYIVTLHAEYVFKSFEYRIFQYLLKPIDQYEFEDSFRRGLECYRNRNKRIILYSDKKHYIVNVDEIILIESSGHNTFIHCANYEYSCHRSLAEFTEELSVFHFLRTHKSYLINMEKVLYYKDNQFYLERGMVADISNRNRSTVLAEFKQYIFSH